MEYAEHVEAIERSAAAFARVIMRSDPDARVPTCPDWTLLDLAKHHGRGMGFWTHVLCEGTGRPKPAIEEDPGPAPTLWFTRMASGLVGEFRGTPPETEVWTWYPGDRSARFAARRMAHETGIHRFDAQTAIGKPEPIDPVLAADGIEEIFEMVAYWPTFGDEAERVVGDGQTLHLHSAEGNEWMIAMNPDGLEITREHAKGDLALKGAVSDLELLLYDRPPIGDVERFGDESVLDAWYRVFKFG
ncbi:MAG: maleylpyruvate isomerase family mycothiol-dependent enzyme [Acidimicrobiia bacterium]|nr:maleylpyruvate isomerase family mycothiol-dependent enzyme [Acidimicrobiia bacterium]